MSASFALTYDGECRTCRLAITLTAKGDLAGRRIEPTARPYAIECPTCGGVVWFAGEPEPEPEPEARSLWW